MTIKNSVYPSNCTKLADGNSHHMKFKAFFFIALGSLLTATVLNNRQEVAFWFFGTHAVSLLWLLGAALAIGLLGGLAISRSGRTNREVEEEEDPAPADEDEDGLNEADRDYIS